MRAMMLAKRPSRAKWRAQWSYLGAAIAGASLVLAGCGGGQKEPETAASETPTEESGDAPLATEQDEESWGEEDAQQAAANPDRPAAEPEADPAAPETRTLEVIQKVVAEKRPAVRACYDKAREKNSALPGGDFVVRMVIDPEGVVKSAEQDFDKSTVKSPDLAKCALAEIQTWKFPPSSKGMETKLNYPFNFKP
jgi:hypothetical protein